MEEKIGSLVLLLLVSNNMMVTLVFEVSQIYLASLV